jgi:hypothetical protein
VIPVQFEPLAAACLEITLANERHAIQRSRRARVALLRARTDRILEGLEELNLLEVRRVPELTRFQLAAMVADLPFEYRLSISKNPSPTELIDLVFDLQAELVLFLTGVKPEEDELVSA